MAKTIMWRAARKPMESARGCAALRVSGDFASRGDEERGAC
jgi:hypothetical protein